MRTLSTSPIDPLAPDNGDDLDNRIVDGVESLRQRLTQRLRFLLGEWDLDTRKGTESVIGFEYTPTLAAAVISDAIQDEGGEELTGAPVITMNLDRDTRQFTFTATVPTIYGDMALAGTAV